MPIEVLEIYRGRDRPVSNLPEPNLGCRRKFLELTHECISDKHPLVKVHIMSRGWFDESSKSLRVMNQVQVLSS
jgi:hypothetical protein